MVEGEGIVTGDPISCGETMQTGGTVAVWTTRRREPYTETGIRRLACIRCGAKAETQWQVCADNNNIRPLCLNCDIALNVMVLDWMGHPNRRVLVAQYIERMTGQPAWEWALGAMASHRGRGHAWQGVTTDGFSLCECGAKWPLDEGGH